MADIINWLNANQGFVMGLLTLVYVVTTVVMAGLMMHSNRLTRQLDEQRSRPAVIFNILSRQHCVHAVLKNNGLTSAYDVEVSCNPPLAHPIGGKDMETAITTHPVSFLAPQQEIADFIDVGHQFYNRYPKPVFTGTVRYKDRVGNWYAEDFEIDLTVLKNRTYLSRVDLGKELEKIRRALESLGSGFKKPLVRTIDEKEYREEQRQWIESYTTKPKQDPEETEESNQRIDDER